MRSLALAFALLLANPLLASANDESPPPPASADTSHARLVPTMRDNVFVGLKVFAIKPGGRFDQPHAPFHAGDLIELVDDLPVTTPPGQLALFQRVIAGHTNSRVTVRRDGAVLILESKALGEAVVSAP